MKCAAAVAIQWRQTGSARAMRAYSVGVRARVPGFAYSPALAASKLVWNASTLDRWLSNPEALVPGQRMGYSLSDAAQRADVIAYLSTLKAAP